MSADDPVITERRTLKIGQEWVVNEFGGGEYYMLVATVGGVQFHAHFDDVQWAQFQKLVSP